MRCASRARGVPHYEDKKEKKRRNKKKEKNTKPLKKSPPKIKTGTKTPKETTHQKWHGNTCWKQPTPQPAERKWETKNDFWNQKRKKITLSKKCEFACKSKKNRSKKRPKTKSHFAGHFPSVAERFDAVFKIAPKRLAGKMSGEVRIESIFSVLVVSPWFGF